jgi:hypothetical protein
MFVEKHSAALLHIAQLDTKFENSSDLGHSLGQSSAILFVNAFLLPNTLRPILPYFSDEPYLDNSSPLTS